MNVVGRHVSGSNATSHHQRQRSDNYLDLIGGKSGSKWLLHKSVSSSSSQDFGYGSKTFTPSVCSRSSSLRKLGDGQVWSELSPGLLDLHSLDTDLLPEYHKAGTRVPLPNTYEGYKLNNHSRGKSFDDYESSLIANQIGNRSSNLGENNLVKSFSLDKERANNVAKIRVVVRKRPLNKKEISKKEEDIITIEPNSCSLTVHETKLKVDLTEYVEKHEFVFDAVLNDSVSNDEVYHQTVEPIVPLIFQRTKATCFAYGQTGSGKTYTMEPLPLKASQDIFRLMQSMYRNQGFQLFLSFFEIYGGKLFDLLNDRKKLCMREDGKQQVCIVGLQEYKVSDVEVIREFIEKGTATRRTGTTGANEESSRSHAVLQLAIKRSVDGSESKPARLIGKLSFIDLAGSERGADTTDNDKQTRIEGAEINKSLLALKECIRALDSDQGHIPFRGSKLTEVLRDSFVGDSRTVMISCISPSSGSCEHTLNTLRYADRVKSLSKGCISKRDPLSLSSSNLRDSSALPLTSGILTESNFADSIADEKNRFGWQKMIKRETSPPIQRKETSIPFNVACMPSGRAEGNSFMPVYSNSDKGQKTVSIEVAKNELDYTDETYGQGKQSGWNSKGAGTCQLSAFEDRLRADAWMKQRNVTADWSSNSQSEDDLNLLLKEEEDLVCAHRKQVEETLEIVRKEMSLLVQADQPGNHLDDYISKLDAILSQKAAGILQLQRKLAQFQKHLNEQSVLISSCDN